MGKFKLFIFAMLGLVAGPGYCGGSMTGKDYSNFGGDLEYPVFAKAQVINLYKNKSDATPIKSIKTYAQVTMDDDSPSCWNAKPADGWVKCRLDGTGGWVKRDEFVGPGEYVGVEKWPFKYWSYIAGTNTGEEGVMLFRAVAHSPYLIKPDQFDNAFFIAYFDTQGFAISPKDNKKTGDRVFLVDNAVYLAPADGVRRARKKWLFLGYFNDELQALCPSTHKASCYSAVNLAPDWTGIKSFYAAPDAQFAYDSKRESPLKRIWYGTSEIAFARHADPLAPLMYRVPEEVLIKGEMDNTPDVLKKKSREKPYCLLDCKGVANQIKVNGKPLP